MQSIPATPSLFNVHIPALAIVLFGLAAVALAYICVVYCRRLLLVRRAKRLSDERLVEHRLSEDDQAAPAPSTERPRVSIIIFTRNEPEALLRNLPKILEQEYAPGYEVIVVNDGSDPDTNYAVGVLRMTHPNLYLTFTPDGARSLSRKKLAITLGVKAAKGDIVIVTDAMVNIESKRWIDTMVQPFDDPSTSVVLGYGIAQYPNKRAIGRQTRIFDLTADAATWLAAAASGHPYRGCGYNLAYRREVFFDNKGFSRSLNLRAGDDDIFVYEITTGDNTVVQLADDAIARHEAPSFKRQTRNYRLSHIFTGRRVPIIHRRLMAAGEWLMWAVIGASVGAVWLCGLRNLIGWSIAAALIIGMIVTVGISWRRTCAVLHAPVSGWAAPFLALSRPLRNALLTLRSRLSKSAHYTWQ